MANKNFLIKNGLTVGGVDIVNSSGVLTQSLITAVPSSAAASTQSVGNSSTSIATTAYVRGEIDALINSAPGTLNTLDELAAAINDDAAFNTTLTSAVALKAPLASPTFTGNIDVAGTVIVGSNNSYFAENNIRFKATGASYIDVQAIDQDLIFRTSDASALDTTALRLDGSNGGQAIFAKGASFNDHVYLGDNDKLTLGGGDDATIFSDGTSGYMRGVYAIQNKVGDKDALTFADGGATTLHYNNAAKLATTNTGVDITGTITCDGLTTGNNQNVSIGGILKGSDSTFQILTSTSDGSDSSRIRMCGGGGTGSSRGAQLELQGNEHAFVGEAQLAAGDVSGAFLGLNAPHSSGYITASTAGAERMRITSAGLVGIGDTDPQDKLHVVGDIRISGGNQMTNELAFFNDSGDHYLAGIRQASNSSYNDSGSLQFLTSGTSNAAESVKMVIDTQGNVGIGTTAPTQKLHVSGGSGASTLVQFGEAYDTSLYIKATNTASAMLRFQNASDTVKYAMGYRNDSNAGPFRIRAATTLDAGGHKWDFDAAGTFHIIPNNTAALMNITGSGSGNDATIHMATALNARGMYVDDSAVNTMKFYTGYGKGVANREIFMNNEGDLAIGSGRKFYIDGQSDSYIQEVSANNMAFAVGGNVKMNLTTAGLDVSSEFITDSYKTIYDTSATGFAQGASADTWYEITSGPSTWNGYGTDQKHWAYIIRFFWTSGVDTKGYNHRVTVMTGNISSNASYNSGSFTTCQMGDYSDGSTLSGPIFASHHTSVTAEGNFKCAVKWHNGGSGNIRMHIKTNAPPHSAAGNTQMKIWRY